MKLTAYFQRLFFVLVLVACLTIAQEVDDEREFSYAEDSENGPPHWGEIRPEWRICNSGRMQSPIDIVNERVEIASHLGELKKTYKPSNAALINRGHDMMLSWPGGAGHINIDGTLYQLNQLHWHTPSEHTINGRRFDMEAHLVHQSNDNRTAVIGILYQIGHPDSLLSVIKRDLEKLEETRDVEKVVGVIDPELVKFGSKEYYRYIGSLTTPPCREGVTWTILHKVNTVSREQLELIRDAIHDDVEANARPIQPINERIVQFYKPTDHQN